MLFVLKASCEDDSDDSDEDKCVQPLMQPPDEKGPVAVAAVQCRDGKGTRSLNGLCVVLQTQASLNLGSTCYGSLTELNALSLTASSPQLLYSIAA